MKLITIKPSWMMPWQKRMENHYTIVFTLVISLLLNMITRKENGSKKMKIMLDQGAYMPTRAHEADAGYDLYAREDAFLPMYDNAVFDTGVHVEIPKGYVGMIKSKSGLNVNFNLLSEGVIDSGYTGSIVVKLYNNGNKNVQISKGQKISQLVIMPIITPELELVEALEDTERGAGGFGSTGKF